jgi:hypothetical protein
MILNETKYVLMFGPSKGKRCNHCGTKLDVLANEHGIGPSFGICWECREVYRLDTPVFAQVEYKEEVEGG